MSEVRTTLSELRDDVKKQLESSHATAIEVVRLQGTIDRLVDRVVEVEHIKVDIADMKKKDEAHSSAIQALNQDMVILKKIVYGAVGFILIVFLTAVAYDIGWKP